jgi:DNA-binding NarL/FixJ family response regulator
MPRLQSLTPTETYIARKLSCGWTVIEIAEKLDRSPKTVDTHKTRIYKKLRVRHRIALARRCIKKEILPLQTWLRSRA